MLIELKIFIFSIIISIANGKEKEKDEFPICDVKRIDKIFIKEVDRIKKSKAFDMQVNCEMAGSNLRKLTFAIDEMQCDVLTTKGLEVILNARASFREWKVLCKQLSVDSIHSKRRCTKEIMKDMESYCEQHLVVKEKRSELCLPLRAFFRCWFRRVNDCSLYQFLVIEEQLRMLQKIRKEGARFNCSLTREFLLGSTSSKIPKYHFFYLFISIIVLFWK
ncbi:hypothetical protein SNEBB_008747 [Seison nebaliae]|nr:hypothetical protein SNEBB_008747 [Seison nebaliae]